MATLLISSTHYFHGCRLKFRFLVFFLFVLFKSCYGYGTFGFDMHHRFSSPVKEMFGVEGVLPEKDSAQYFAVMAHRDRVIHGRGLAATGADNSSNTPLTFYFGNDTYRIDNLGFLHYANVSVGTPSVSFLVALDTGSNLFWLPCDCSTSSCVHSLNSSSGPVELNIYSPNASSTSEAVPCNSALCSSSQRNRCSNDQSNCPYQAVYLSNGTSSTGYFVQDLLHLISDDTESKAVDANVTLGCGLVQTGSFMTGGAPNGLFGLGMSNLSVPSTLARNGYASGSFSMCFSSDGIGRISFGDKGSTGQGETPINQGQSSSSLYNISITQTSIGGRDGGLQFSAIFDSGTSFTYLNDPAYTFIAESFNNLVKEKRRDSTSVVPFDYCYSLSPNQTELRIPTVNLVMSGGDYFNVTDPIIITQLNDGSRVYCLGMIRSGDVNIIGQNFMTGYRIVFDLERKILGWKPSNCYSNVDTNNLPVTPNPAVPPATAVNPEATSNTSGIPVGSPSPGSHSSRLRSFTVTLMTVLVLFFTIV